MSQASGPSVVKERPVSGEESPPRHLRYPSFRFTRKISRSPAGSMKQKKETGTLRSRSEPTMSESHDVSDVNDGKLFHVRITLGYLKAIEKTKKQKSPPSTCTSDTTTSLVTAFASVESQLSQDHNFAQSLPLNPVDINNVVWPKQSSMRDDGTNKSNRRLYFSIVLQKEEEDADLRNVLTCEDDMSTVTGTSAWNHDETESYSPELIKIQLGVARGKDVLHLGVATLIIDGNDVRGKQIDLPVRPLLPGENSSPKSSPKMARGLKRLFSRTKTTKSSFVADDHQYSFTPNAILRIRLDVVGSHATHLQAISIMNGPSVWGDGVEDDSDSFASIVVVDMSGSEKSPQEEEKDGSHKTRETTSGNAHTLTSASEFIEVVNDPTTGTSIISAPREYVEPETADSVSSNTPLPLTSVDIAPQENSLSGGVYREPTSSIFGFPPMLCGFNAPFAPQAIEADQAQSLDLEDSSTIATSLYKGTSEEAWKIAAKKNRPTSVRPTASSGVVQKKSLTTVDERTADATSRSSGSLSTSRRLPTVAFSIGEDTVASLDEAKRALQRYAHRTGIEYDEVLQQLDLASSPSDLVSLEPSIGEDTIDSIFEAKELLQRYADRTGIDIEDLLEGYVLTSDGYVEGSTGALSPTSSRGASRSADQTERTTQTTESTRSRFSLFVDD